MRKQRKGPRRGPEPNQQSAACLEGAVEFEAKSVVGGL